MTGGPARNKPPHNANVLGRWLTESADHSGVAAGRLRRWLGFMIVAAMLDQARHSDDDGPLFLVKGGVAMELRVGGSARATRDLDAALRAAITELAEHLDPALRTGFGDFAATRTELEPIRDTGAVRCDIKITYRHRPVVTVPVEIAEVEASMGSEVDHVPARPLSDLGIETPGSVPCIALRWQIAQPSGTHAPNGSTITATTGSATCSIFNYSPASWTTLPGLPCEALALRSSTAVNLIRGPQPSPFRRTGPTATAHSPPTPASQ